MAAARGSFADVKTQAMHMTARSAAQTADRAYNNERQTEKNLEWI